MDKNRVKGQLYSISKRQLTVAAIVWLALPLVIFLATWIRPVIGWTLALAVSACLFRSMKNLADPDAPVIYIDRPFWIMVVLMFLFTVYTGIGGLFYQDWWDHGFRNAIFQDLVDNPWPVVKNNLESGELELLCYYHAFWLPAAAVAKLSGSMVIGNMVQLLYAFIGFVLIAILVVYYLKVRRIKIWYILFLAFYCGWDVVLFPFWASDCGIEVHGIHNFYLYLKDLPWFRFSAPALPSLALYIYNQGIAAWLAVGLLLSQRNNYPVSVLLYSLMFLFAPIPAVGLLPVMIYLTLSHFKESISMENIVGVLVFLIVGLYFMSNNQAKNPTSDNGVTLSVYVWRLGLFLMCSYVVYFPYVWKKIKGDVFLWIMFVTASIIPFFILTKESDLGCRVGIPLTFYFALIVLKSATDIRNWSKLKIACFAVTFVIGMVGTSGMYCKNIYLAYRCLHSRSPWQQHWIPSVFDEKKCPLKNNFVASGESLFTRYILDRDDSMEDPALVYSADKEE